MDENEKYCKERLNDPLHNWDYEGHRVVTADNVGVYRLSSEAEAWAAARKYIAEEREEEIRQVEEEIMELQDDISCYHTGEHFYPIYRRILAREQAALAELQRGMKATR